MMEWALSILFGVAVALLVLSFVKAKKTQEIEKQEMEQLSISLMEEMQELQKQLHDLALDNEITAREAGVKSVATKQRAVLRQVIDLHRRGYSYEGIAAQTTASETEIRLMLAPYIEAKNERRQVANEG
ncbi:hypothetical protein [Halalkalibacter krulwichiae]|uniref:Uncharacterized protein n=1 Tax=Halalkalibacter krulwichiae TaxID=199441 RepID=A0A1X9MGX4_9BACI|nr:hypothetical protein [Halalkalibacter krulwichiae]ARK32688.1 hypothetical protein BkAM31D_24095 [Halalkalibacter krulwichiae]